MMRRCFSLAALLVLPFLFLATPSQALRVMEILHETDDNANAK